VSKSFSLALTAGALAVWSCALSGQETSTYTSIHRSDCTSPPEEVTALYSKRTLEVRQCPAPTGWRVLVVSSDENTWIDLAGPGVTWSGERAIVYDSPIGNFPSVGAPPTIEWRRGRQGRLIALIVRVTAQDRDTLSTRRSMLYVVRLQQERACVIGRRAANIDARRLADSSVGCR
jgi:hypothetical protein